MLQAADIDAIFLSLRLAGLSTSLLILLGTPLAWWLARSASAWRSGIDALVTLPLVLPPTVLGFYLLLLLGPQGPVGAFMQTLGLGLLPFTFGGLLLASMVYSLPFVVQPLRQAFAAIGDAPLEAAATLRAAPLDTFWHVVLPLSKHGFLSAAVLGFAHTLGEFGVVLMIGGNIPGQTQVVSMAIYNHVEALEYANAHALAAGLLVFSFVVLLLVYRHNPKRAL